MDIKMYKIAKEFKPDIFLGFGSVRAAHVAWFIRKPCIIFDGDHFTFPYYKWFAKTICLFSGFEKTGKKIINIMAIRNLPICIPGGLSQTLLQQQLSL
jgi:predicted glycosyltransferase